MIICWKDKNHRKNDIAPYAADTTNSWKIATFLGELKVDYDVVLVDLSKDKQKNEDYVKMNPNAHTPTILDYSQEVVEKNNEIPFPVFESVAIMIYLVEKFPGTWSEKLYLYNNNIYKN